MDVLQILEEYLGNFVNWVNSFLWDFLLLILLCGTGIYFTVRLKFVQVTRFWKSLCEMFKKCRFNGEKAGAGGMSSFQSFTTAVAAQIGTGNLAGAATAIVMGGPGAIFWMWLSAFLGMATIFAEATLAQKFKKEQNGKITGGPVYYIQAAFRGRFGRVLAGIFAVLIIIALGFMGNMVQSNSISAAFESLLGTPENGTLVKLITGVVLAAVAGFVFLGGVKRIAAFTEKIVPLMALLYIGGCVVVLAFHWDRIGSAFWMIFRGAFQPQAVLGGAVGFGIKEAIRYGVARGLFSNEAGMGSTPHAHALAKVKHPCEQGSIAMISVFLDTFVVLTLTALVIITSGLFDNGLDGIELTQAAFSQVFGGFGGIFIAVCLLFFAFSTIVGWYFFGEQNIRYLFGEKAVKIYAALVVCFIVLGSLLKVELVWSMADMFNGLMVIPNLLGVLVLSGIVSKLYADFRSRSEKKQKKTKEKSC